MLDTLRPLFASLSSHGVDYLVIGGVAAIAHGVPRLTLDLDILIRSTPDNVRRLLEAFEDAGLGTAALTTVDEILANEVVIFKDRIHRSRRDAGAPSRGSGREIQAGVNAVRRPRPLTPC